MKTKRKLPIWRGHFFCAASAVLLIAPGSASAGQPQAVQLRKDYRIERIENNLGEIASAKLWRIGSHLRLVGTIEDGKYKSPVHVDVEVLSAHGRRTDAFAVEDRERHRAHWRRRRWSGIARNTRFETALPTLPERGSVIRIQLDFGDAADCRLGVPPLMSGESESKQ